MSMRGRNRFCGRSDWWEHVYGSSKEGNLPDYKKDYHEGHCWAPCPYSTQSSEGRTRSLLGLSESDPLPTKVDHTSDGKIHYMKTKSRGAVWGFECTYSGCPYYLANGTRYFYA
jgi:hypothetical protein